MENNLDITQNNVTASSGRAISTDFATRHVLPKIRSNLTWHSNMLKMKYLPEKHPRKSEIAARKERTQEKRQKRRTFRLQNTVLCPSQEIDTTIVPETRVPDVRLSILAVSCVVTSVSAGSQGQFLSK